MDFLTYGTDYWKSDGLNGLGYEGNNRAKQVQKLPNYRWSMVGGLIESLRLQAQRTAEG
jgi:hypothetical protein